MSLVLQALALTLLPENSEAGERGHSEGANGPTLRRLTNIFPESRRLYNFSCWRTGF
jgi:hypothetical protein